LADNPIPVVPDTGTEKAARLAAAITGQHGAWVRLDCHHERHIQHQVELGELLECPTCPPSSEGMLARRRVVQQVGEPHLSARLAAEPLAPSKAQRLAAEAVTAAGREPLVEDVTRLVGDLVSSAIRHTAQSVELVIDAHDDYVRVEVHDDLAGFAGGGELAWSERPAG
jgi:signal transduction histidine kinase